jgi:methionine-S-sulfoxide reductase
VTYNPNVVFYTELLDVFFDIHDSTQVNRQGNDVGTQYRSGIYYDSNVQRDAAIASLKREENRLGKPIATEILAAPTFFSAEMYHQQYLEKGGQSVAKGDLSQIRCYG